MTITKDVLSSGTENAGFPQRKPISMGHNGFAVVELPNVGDVYAPVCVTGCIGIERYGLEMLWCYSRWYAVLCFCPAWDENFVDCTEYKVVAVIPEEQLRPIARWIVEELL